MFFRHNKKTHPVSAVQNEAIKDKPPVIEAENMEIDSDCTLKKYTGQDEVVTVPDGIRKIGPWVFQSNKTVREIILPQSLAEIGNCAFERSTLQKIVLPPNVTKMGYHAFYYCENLESVVLPDTLTEIGSGTFGWCKSLKQITLPSNLKKVGTDAFDLTGITELHIPNSMTYIGERAFHRMKCLEKLYLPSTLWGIGDQAFSFCDHLTEVILPEGLASIEWAAFDACTRLEKVEFPDSLIIMESGAFSRTKISNTEELRAVYARLKDEKAYPKPDGYKELSFSGLKFYYQSEKIDYSALDRQDAGNWKRYGFEHDHTLNDSWAIFKNKAGLIALSIYASVPTFDSGDREWDSYQKLFLFRENGAISGFIIRGGYHIAKILAYKDIRCADEKTKKLLKTSGIF